MLTERGRDYHKSRLRGLADNIAVFVRDVDVTTEEQLLTRRLGSLGQVVVIPSLYIVSIVFSTWMRVGRVALKPTDLILDLAILV
jgi:hypothetical protein